MTDIEKIRELDLQNVEPEHFLEIGSDVLSALRHEILGKETYRKLIQQYQ